MDKLLSCYADSYSDYSHENFFYKAMDFLNDTNLYSYAEGASYGTICVNNCYAEVFNTDYPLDIYNKIKSIYIDGFSILCNAKYKQDLFDLEIVLKNFDVSFDKFSSLSKVERLCLVTIEEIELKFADLVRDVDYYTKKNNL